MRFADTIAESLKSAKVEGGFDDAMNRFASSIKGRVIFIGNGGSASIASHMAIDWTKNAGITAIAFNDVATLTCLANDFGYENVFAKQLEYYASEKDLAVIISSSGKSPNLLRAADKAKEMGLFLVTLTGMNPDNALRKKGVLNFYIPHDDYGVVEISHLTILHSVVSEKRAPRV